MSACLIHGCLSTLSLGSSHSYSVGSLDFPPALFSFKNLGKDLRGPFISSYERLDVQVDPTFRSYTCGTPSPSPWQLCSRWGRQGALTCTQAVWTHVLALSPTAHVLLNKLLNVSTSLSPHLYSGNLLHKFIRSRGKTHVKHLGHSTQ